MILPAPAYEDFETIPEGLVADTLRAMACTRDAVAPVEAAVWRHLALVIEPNCEETRELYDAAISGFSELQMSEYWLLLQLWALSGE